MSKTFLKALTSVGKNLQSGIVKLKGNTVDYINVLENGLKNDGTTDNTSALNTLLAAVPSGSTLFFPLGTYVISSTVNITKAIKFFGAGATIKCNQIVSTYEFEVSGINFSDCTINAIVVNDANLRVEHCKFDNIGTGSITITYQGSAIYAKNTDLFVNDCDFTNCHGQGAVYHYNGANVHIYNSRFNNNDYRAINMFGSTTVEVSGEISGNTIENCGINNTTGSGVACNGIYSMNGTGVKFHDNTVLNSAENGVEGVFASVENNYIDGSGVDYVNKPTPSTEGIYISTPDDTHKTIIRGNTIKNCYTHGIYCYSSGKDIQNIIIADNNISDCNRSSINLNSSTSVKNCKIKNNSVEQLISVNNSDPSNEYVGSIDKLYQGAFGTIISESAYSLTKYFTELGDWTKNNCTPTFEEDSDLGSYVCTVAYSQYNRLNSPSLPAYAGKQAIIVKGNMKGLFKIHIYKNGSYLKTMKSVSSDAYGVVTASGFIESSITDAITVVFEPQSDGTMYLNYVTITSHY